MIGFSLFGIPVRVLPWFWITMALIGGATRANSKEAIFYLLLFVLAGFISILVHELGHALTARAFGKQVHIVLQAFGGYAAYSGGAPLSRINTFLVTAAGPIFQILAAVLVWFGAKFLPGVQPEAAYLIRIFIVISVLWAFLNLLPVLPLDGGRILEKFLGPSRLRLTIQISMSIAIGIALLALFSGWGGFILPLFMGFAAYENFKALKQIS